MNRFSKCLSAFLAVVACTSCEKEPLDGQREDGQFKIVATTDGVIVQEWNEKDRIKVVYGTELYTFTANGNGKTVDFTETENTLTADMITGDALTAYYNCSNMFGTFRIQAEQMWQEGKSSAVLPMYAHTVNTPENNTLALSFKPLASVFRLVIQPYDIAIEKLVIAPAAGATISAGAVAGQFTVDATNGSVTVNGDAAINSVSLEFPVPLDLKQGVTLNIPIGWFSVEGGMTMIMTYEGNKEYTSTIWEDDGVVKSYNDEGGVKSSKVIVETMEFDANSFPRAYYVKTTGTAESKGLSWDNPTTLSSALANAVSGSVIHVAAGTYVPENVAEHSDVSEDSPSYGISDELKTFEVFRNVAVIGGYPADAAAGAVADARTNATILSGAGKSCHTMVVGAPVVAGEKVILKGITITGGNAAPDSKSLNYNGYTLAGNYAGGLALVGSVVDMDNVTVAGNASVNAGGLFCIGSKVNMTGSAVSNNTSSGNGAGAWFTTDTDLVMDGCMIDGNRTTGTSSNAAGLYLYVPDGKGMKAEIKNTAISGNEAYAHSGSYIRDDSGSQSLDFLFTDCRFVDNKADNMSSTITVLNAKGSFVGCDISNNNCEGNGTVYIFTSAGGNSEVIFDGCEIHGNYAKGLAPGIYAYNNGGEATICLYILNSAIYGNSTVGRGTVYARNNAAGTLDVTCVNSTFADNTAGSWGSAINILGAANKKAAVNLISCTVSGNISTHATYVGGVSLESAGTTLNTYNTIIAGNSTSDNKVADVMVKNGVAASIAHKYSFIGSEYYGGTGTVEQVAPAFDYTTMFGTFADGVISLTGTGNPALTKGMSVTELKALSGGAVTSDLLGKDQKANDRTGNVAGAFVGK